jgi:hypothetical protein
MRGLAPPDPALWRTRSAWFWRAHDVNAGPHPLDLDPRATALLAELELLFCVGAWASVVMVGWTLVEGVRRRSAAGDETPPPDVDWLREKRNRLAHLAAESESAEAPDEAALEALAQGALRVTFKTLFAAGWTGGAR